MAPTTPAALLSRLGFDGAPPVPLPGSASSGSSAAAPPRVGPSSGLGFSFAPSSSSSSSPSSASSSSDPAAAYISGLQVGNVVKLRGNPDNYTILEINPNRADGKFFRLSKRDPSSGVTTEVQVPPQAIQVPSLGGKSRRFKKTKRRRQKKSRKNKK
jgi:hypothetical protein